MKTVKVRTAKDLKRKTRKYRPFTRKVIGTLDGILVNRSFKNEKSAQNFAAGLDNAEILHL